MQQQPIYFLVGIKMKSNVAVTLLLVLSFHSHAKALIIGGDLVTAGKADGVINFYTTDDEGDLSNSCTGSKCPFTINPGQRIPIHTRPVIKLIQVQI